MTPSLPNGLVPIAATYQSDDPGGVMRTEVAGGFSRYALDWDQGPQRYTITLAMDDLLLSVWTAFYHHIIKKGAIAFYMPIDSGFGLAQSLCNIMPGTYSTARTQGMTTIISFTVETENMAYSFSDTDAQSFLDVYNTYGADSTALLARIAQFATVDTLVL